MRRSPLIVTGLALTAAIAVGGAALITTLLLERRIDPLDPQRSTGPVASMPADRYHSRGIVPLEIDPELGALEVYLVGPDGVLHPPPQGLRHDIWAVALRIMTPEDAAATLEIYKVGDDADSERTAWVREHGERDGEWILGVNLATSDDLTQVTATLIHEYAHLLSLRDGQVVAFGDGCTTVLLPEGCAQPGSYLHAFFLQFWASHADAAPSPANADAETAREFFQSQPGAFVSEYAAMNLAEDFAESFAAYVHADRVGPAFAGRLTFFDRFAEMAAIRDRIRADFGDELGVLRIE